LIEMAGICSRCNHWFGSCHEDNSDTVCDDCAESLAMERLQAENEQLKSELAKRSLSKEIHAERRVADVAIKPDETVAALEAVQIALAKLGIFLSWGRDKAPDMKTTTAIHVTLSNWPEGLENPEIPQKGTDDE